MPLCFVAARSCEPRLVGNLPPASRRLTPRDEQTVRHAIHAFNQQGRAALQAGSSRPHHLPTVLRADVTAEQFKTVLHRPPRDFGFETSLWTLDLLVKQCVRLGWMTRPVSIETMRQTLSRVGINWKRAKRWITSPDPLYQEKKRLATDC